MTSFIKEMFCTECENRYSEKTQRKICNICKEVLEVRYNYEAAKESMTKRTIKKRPRGIWRYFELLPLIDRRNVISLGEGQTFLHHCNSLSENLGIPNLLLKNETTNPTGSFLDRGSSVEISIAKERKQYKICCGSTGNLAASVVAYAAKASVSSKVYMAQKGRIDIGKFYQILAYGADVEIVKTRKEAISLASQKEPICHSITSYNPHFLEGTKTLVFDLCEQLDWKTPDWIITPMGSGGNISMIWKGILELQEMGLIGSETPKLIGTQVEGISPIVDAFKNGQKTVRPSSGKPNLAMDIGVAEPVCGNKALEAIRKSKGLAIDLTDKEIIQSVRDLARKEGIFAEPASATTIAALRNLVAEQVINPNDVVVCMITGTGLKSPEIAESFVQGRKDIGHLLSKFEGRKYTTEIGRTKVCILRLLSLTDSYGYAIWKNLSESYGIQISIPSVYQHLTELSRGGLIVEIKTILSPEKRVRKFYDLTERGRWTLAQIEKISE
ncbi:MAG: threonine synthase [Candidatus Lokiarchaeota archaeon]|nr:threonine synthase [Candidatus Lokiarchaeota archaeon]